VKGSALLGLLVLGLVFAGRLLPQPAGSLVVLGLIAVFVAVAAACTWIRTRLRFVTAGMVLGLVAVGVMAWASWEGRLHRLLFSNSLTSVVLVSLFVAAAACYFLESRFHPADWRRWKDHMQDATLLDVLRMRHIPWLISKTAAESEGGT